MDMQAIMDNPASSAVVGVSVSGLMAIVTGTVFLSTGLPALIGATLYATQKWRTDKSLLNFLAAYAGAGAIGWWGGPWFANFLPQAEAALPIIAFASAYWGIEFATDLKAIVIKAINKRIGGS